MAGDLQLRCPGGQVDAGDLKLTGLTARAIDVQLGDQAAPVLDRRASGVGDLGDRTLDAGPSPLVDETG
jgi:hypothetical protein